LPVSTGIRARFASKAHLPTSAPLRAGHPPVSGQLYGTIREEFPVLRPRFPAAFQPPAFASWAPCPARDFRPLYSRPTALPAHTRACTADPGEVYTFRTHETQTGPGALSTPGTAVLTGHRGIRGRRLPPHSGWSLPPRRSIPARSVYMTRHQQEFPGSRPIPVFPRACGYPGWNGTPWAFP